VPVEVLGEFSRRLNNLLHRERRGADADVWVRVASGKGVAERLVNIVGNMEPDYSGSPLRIQGCAIGPGVGASALLRCGGQKVRNSPGEEPRIKPVFWRMIPLMGARSDLHLM
jgi:hypothetical protein